MTLRKVDEIKGILCCIDRHSFKGIEVFAFVPPGHVDCGVYYEEGGYYFEHNGSVYCCEFGMRVLAETQAFENAVIEAYYECGNWYDAFKIAAI